MQTQQHILIVDDDRGIRDELARFLRQHGFAVSLAEHGDAMRALLEKETFDLIILDVMMPGDDGMVLCRELRASSSVPIIMLTAVSEEIERIIGLEMGADDYLNKPFNPRELLARIKAILRRSGFTAQDQQQVSDQTRTRYCFSGWKLDRATRRLVSPDACEISLSSGEFDLLVALLERPQIVLSRDQLLDITKNREAGPYDRSIDIQVSRLRQKIEIDHKKPQIIKTVRGGGYVLATSVERQ